MRPLFFVSYASSTGDRGQAQRFHSDVQHEIHSLLGRGPETDGLLKRAAPRSGPDPAVLTCRAMIALYSAAYLRDGQCAAEWSIFLARMDREARRTGQRPASLIGVLWRPEGLVLPRIVADTGTILDDVGEGYGGLGALGLMCDPVGQEGYRLLVRRAAQQITRLAAGPPLPEMTESDSRASAPRFGPGRPASTSAAQALRGRPRARRAAPPEPTAPPPPASRSPLTALPDKPPADRRHVIVALVTGERSRMAELRHCVAAYGDTAEDWRPFRPQDDESAVSIVQRALHACDIDRMTVMPLPPGPVVPDEDTAAPAAAKDPADAAPGAAGRPGARAPVVVLVDPWMTADTTFPALWMQLRRHASYVAAVIVVLSRSDQETWGNATRLRRALARTPASELDAPHHEAGSAEALAHTVIGALADARPYTPPVIPGELSLEGPDERLTRRQRERAAWATRQPGSRLAPSGSSGRGPLLSGMVPEDLRSSG